MSSTAAPPLRSFSKLFIGGRWAEPSSSDRIEVISPVTEELIGHVPATQPADIDAAVQAAREAFDHGPWPRMSPSERAGYLLRIREEVQGRLEEMCWAFTQEIGAPLPISKLFHENALKMWTDGATLYQRFAFEETRDTPDGPVTVLREPVGVVGTIIPWNGPVATASLKLAPALAYGNAVLLKPAPAATATAMRLGELVGVHLPAGLLAVLPGGAATGQAVLGAVDALSFTGSAAVGAALATDAVRRGIPVQAEMGGQNPSVVLEDADHETAASIIAGAAMGYAGQKCTATSRVVVTGDAAGFVDALVAAVERLPVGDPGAAATVVGPVITEAARRAVVAGADAVTAAGGRVLTGGRSLARDGFFVAPTVVGGIDPSHRVAQEEIFGPIVAVLPARDLEEAIAFANGVRYGLAAALFTRDLDRALGVLPRLEAGLVRVNAPTSGVDLYAPFGGVKDSSIGPREQGKAAREFFTWTQTATIAPAGGS